MLLESTAQHGPRVSFTEALVRGIAPDGSLYMPIDWPHISLDELTSWRKLPFPDLAVAIAKRLLAGELEDAEIERLTRDALDFQVPTVPIFGRHHVLELFHGPTLAFKDFGARFLARFFGYLARERGREATILVATSGDTGSAVAQGFYGVPGVRVVVLYPDGKVSRFQEAQMASLGENVTAVRVSGTFDDCQRLVKTAFLDDALARLNLSSANSINIGRLLPQSFYYVASYLAVAKTIGDPVIFSVPTGNLGNLTAGLLAGQLGVPVSRFVAATNTNDVLPEYLSTGVFRPRPSVTTPSNAMDVGNPSNFVRLVALHDLSLDDMRCRIWSVAIDVPEMEATIRRTHADAGYVLDPHSAVGLAAALRYETDELGDGAEPIITLGTAHPAKFSQVIQKVLNFDPPLPDEFGDWEAWPLRAVHLDDTGYEAFRRFLMDRL